MMANGPTENSRLDVSVKQNLHHSFVELESFTRIDNGFKWVERARWVKFEEDVDIATNQWCPPFVPVLSLRAVSELKACLLNGCVCIGVQDSSMADIARTIVRQMLEKRLIYAENASHLESVLMAKHKHIRKKADAPSLGQKWLSAVKSKYPSSRRNTIVSLELQSVHNMPTVIEEDESNSSVSNGKTRLVDITSKLPSNTEVTTILTATFEFIQHPMAIFIRLKDAANFDDLNEVSWPARFICFIAGPPVEAVVDYFQLGRCLGTLMSNPKFLTLAYFCEVGEDLLSGIDRFLDESIVISAGDWTKQNLIQSVHRWEHNQARDSTPYGDKIKRGATFALHSQVVGSKDRAHPLSRSGKPFGCLFNDIKRKAAHYVSDLMPVFDIHCLAAVLFIYLSALAPCIAFGGLLSENTKGQIGISEMIIATGISGILFSLFSGQPLLVVGATGPMLIMESKIYELANMMQLEFLPWRACIGIWTVVICLVFVAFDLCGLIRQVTRFTEEIFAVLVSLIFIQKALSFIIRTFIEHPVGEHVPQQPCAHVLNKTIELGNATFHLVKKNYTSAEKTEGLKHPCYSLMTAILIILTFLFAFYIRKVRSSMYFPVKIRRIISDFGVILSVLTVVLIDSTLSDNFTKKLSIKQDHFVRKWFVNPFGESRELGIGYVFLAIIPAFLVSIILFIETGITSVMLDKREHKLKKGFGYHLDLLVVGLLVGAGSLLRLPWICTSPVNSLSHFHTLTVLSSDHAPGNNPYIVEVKEQRVTNVIIHVLIGSSLLLAPMLEQIPVAVLYGVFLYVGFTSLFRMEFIHRLQLLLIPYKLHPDSRFVRKVKTMKIHLFTLVQLCCVVLLAVIKETQLAAIFPFLILCLVPLRKCLRLFLSEEELEDLDNPEDEDEFGVSEEFEIAHVPLSI